MYGELSAALVEFWGIEPALQERLQLQLSAEGLSWIHNGQVRALKGVVEELEAGKRYELGLLGSSLSIELAKPAGTWKVRYRGELLAGMPNGQALVLSLNDEGDLALTIPAWDARKLFLLDARVQVDLKQQDLATSLILAPGGVELRSTGNGLIPIEFDLAGRGEKGGLDYEFSLPLTSAPETTQRQFKLTLKAPADTATILARWLPNTEAWPWSPAVPSWADLPISKSLELRAFRRALLGDVDHLLGDLLPSLNKLTNGTFEAQDSCRFVRHPQNGRIEVSGLRLSFAAVGTNDQNKRTLTLVNGTVTLDARLRLEPSVGIRFEVLSDYPFLPSDESPLTCVLLAGKPEARTHVTLAMSTTGWELAASSADSSVAIIVVPGLGDWEQAVNDGPQLASRFVFDLVPSDDGVALAFGTKGVSFRALARERSIDLAGLESGTVVGGTLQVRHGEWEIEARGEAKLPWFEGARGALTVRGSGQGKHKSFGATFEVTMLEGWTDPSGVLSVRNPSVGVTIEWKRGAWDVDGYVGGSLVFNRVPFLGNASAWVRDIFDGLSVDFERISLRKLGSLEGIGVRLALRRPPRVALWNVFQLDLRGVRIFDAKRIELDGDVGFAFGAVRFVGSLPSLGIQLGGGSVRLDVSKPPSFRGSLQAPSGVRVEMAFKRKKDGISDVLMGAGSITAPTIPDVAVMVTLGRFLHTDGGHRPTIAVYASTAVNIPVFVGIVLKRAGVGFGVYRKLRGIDAVQTAADAYALLRSGDLPQPGEAESWELDENTAFSLVAQLQIAATTSPHAAPDLYVGDLVLSLDSQLRLASFGKVWLLTSPNQALTAEFQDRPYARGVMVIDAARPSVVAAYESAPNPNIGIAKDAGILTDALGGVLGLVQTRASFEARDGLFDLTLGPNRAAFRLGPFHARGSTLLGFRGSAAGVHALASIDLSAGFSAGIELSMGRVRAGVRAQAGFAASTLLYGAIENSRLLLAADVRVSAHASLAVWVEIRFFVRIKLGFVKITISFSVRFTMSFSIQVSAAVALALGVGKDTGLALSARAPVSVRVAGIRVSGTLPVNVGQKRLLDMARKAARRAKRAHLLPSGGG